MSLAVGAALDSKNMGFDENREEGDTLDSHGKGNEDEKIGDQMSENSVYATEDEGDDEGTKIELGPQLTLKEELEKDKILSLSIVAPERPDLVLPIPEDGNLKGLWFTLKEGSPYSLKFSFQVNNNIVAGLKYTNTVWKTGVKVDSSKEMLGTFSPQVEAYTHVMPEDTTPSGMFARGSYSARSKFVDDDNKCYLEINYTFDIRKEWAAT
ncbi:Rho GDP-dissociation inhibitor 1 [Cucurbita argyrosperma subsp. argyrosperma]|nr:Rho GDP-dissociation inhibitor 1 [Cucurbita argyrosperma subsp. argyrosperma]